MIAIIRYIKKFIIRTIILIILILFTISITRATVVVMSIRNAARKLPFNQALVANWNRGFPVLEQSIQNIAPEVLQIDVSPRSEWDSMMLAGPDFCINMALSITPQLWYFETFQPADDQNIAQKPAPPTPERSPTRTDRTREQNMAHVANIQPPSTPAADPDEARDTTPGDDTDLDPNLLWATVVAPEAPLYGPDTKPLGKSVPAGSVFQITTHRATPTGTIYGGTIYSPAGQFDLVVLHERDLQLYRGKDLHDTTLEERQRASNRARILGAIAKRKADLQKNKQANSDNPHQEAYHALLRRYQQLRQEGEPLQQRYENATGQERMKAGNRLREIAQEQRNLTPQIRQLQEQRDSWNARNPQQQQQQQDPEQDETITSLRRELAALPD